MGYGSSYSNILVLGSWKLRTVKGGSPVISCPVRTGVKFVFLRMGIRWIVEAWRRKGI